MSLERVISSWSSGYYQVNTRGDRLGTAGFFGDLSGNRNDAIADCQTETTVYWLAASDGGIFTYRGRQFYGSTGSIQLNKPIVGMSAHRTGAATRSWPPTVGSSTTATRSSTVRPAVSQLNKPIDGIVNTPDGGGYWLVASDGGMFAFGDAPFLGSTGSIHLNKPDRRHGCDTEAAATGSSPRTGASSPTAIRILRIDRQHPPAQPMWAWRPCRTGVAHWFTAADGGDAQLRRRRPSTDRRRLAASWHRGGMAIDGAPPCRHSWILGWRPHVDSPAAHSALLA